MYSERVQINYGSLLRCKILSIGQMLYQTNIYNSEDKELEK